MKKANLGFTLIELLIVIAIIGILGAIAWPYMQTHVIRSRLTEVENALSTVASSVTSYYQDSEGATFPNCGSINEIRTSLGVGLGSITRISQVTVVNGIITGTVANIDPMVDNKTLILTPSVTGDGSIRWIWGASADFPMHLRPKS
jgi:type IV pilus assembly protein PilA